MSGPKNVCHKWFKLYLLKTKSAWITEEIPPCQISSRLIWSSVQNMECCLLQSLCGWSEVGFGIIRCPFGCLHCNRMPRLTTFWHLSELACLRALPGWQAFMWIHQLYFKGQSTQVWYFRWSIMTWVNLWLLICFRYSNRAISQPYFPTRFLSTWEFSVFTHLLTYNAGKGCP